MHLRHLGTSGFVELSTEDAAERLNALANACACRDRHADVGVRDIDPFDQRLHRYEDGAPAAAEVEKGSLSCGVVQPRVLQTDLVLSELFPEGKRQCLGFVDAFVEQQHFAIARAHRVGDDADGDALSFLCSVEDVLAIRREGDVGASRKSDLVVPAL
ncbi:MAG: hypothetical protein V9E89_02220 [Ilumatobacteraceae bacterium]